MPRAYHITVWLDEPEDGTMKLVHEQIETDEHVARWKAGLFAVLGLPYDGVTGPEHPDGPGPSHLLVNVTPVE